MQVKGCLYIEIGPMFLGHVLSGTCYTKALMSWWLKFWGNSIFSESNFDSNDASRKQLDTCHNSWVIMTQVKLWQVWINNHDVRATCIAIQFESWSHKLFVERAPVEMHDSHLVSWISDVPTQHESMIYPVNKTSSFIHGWSGCRVPSGKYVHSAIA